MEFGLHETLPIYSGGLGVLSGDHLKEASDLGLPFVGVGLMYAEGYFSQRISEDGWQESLNNPLRFDDMLVLPVLEEDGTALDRLGRDAGSSGCVAVMGNPRRACAVVT